MKNSTKKIINSSVEKIQRKELTKTIKWLLTLPDGEASDKILNLRHQMIKEKQTLKWLEFQILDKCEQEVKDFIEWNSKI
jgi:hypothetical protein